MVILFVITNVDDRYTCNNNKNDSDNNDGNDLMISIEFISVSLK